MRLQGISHRVILVLLLSLHLVQSAFILRIRLSSGAIQRFEVEEEETINGLREKLREKGIIGGDDVSFTLKDRTYSALSSTIGAESVESAELAGSADGEQTIRKLEISSGEILSIIRPAAPKEHSKEGSSASEGDNDVVGVPVPAKQIKKAASKRKPTSIADLEKTRKELIKVTRQKTTGGRSVSMTSSAGRILKRLATTGGYALLLGKTVKASPSKNTKSAPKGTSIAALSKLENAAKEKVEVHAVCEIFQYSEEDSEGEGRSVNVLPENLSDLPCVATYAQIAESLGLSVVGCCVGLPTNMQVKESKAVMWSSSHVFAALQLRSAVLPTGSVTAKDAPAFIVVSVCKAISPENIPDETTKNGKSTVNTVKNVKKMKSKQLVADGISLEAFQLSDQANILFEKNILPMKRLKNVDQKASAFSSYSSKTNAMKRLAEKASGKKTDSKSGTENNGFEDKIEMESDVLISNSETKSVDPFLLTVPLAINNLKMIKTKTNKESSKNSQDRRENKNEEKELEKGQDFLNKITFEHSFPSECEIKNSENTEKLSKLHFKRILSELSLESTKERMRDPHFLLYISRILDPPTRDSMCRSLMDRTTKFPGMVKVALDMVKISLDPSRGDSNSVGRRSGRFIADDDDDDDE